MDSTTRWLSMLGIGTLCFGLSLFVLRIPIRTIIVFFIIGVPLVALWLYVDANRRTSLVLLPHNNAYVRFVNIKKQRVVIRKTVHVALSQREILLSDILSIRYSS